MVSPHVGVSPHPGGGGEVAWGLSRGISTCPGPSPCKHPFVAWVNFVSNPLLSTDGLLHWGNVLGSPKLSDLAEVLHIDYGKVKTESWACPAESLVSLAAGLAR